MLKIQYLRHSGFLVETDRHFLIFDYWKDSPDSKAALPDILSGAEKRVIVFASHRHSDHFNPGILDWKRGLPSMRLVLSDDIAAVPDDGVFLIGPGQEMREEDFFVRTLASTDEGVAFLVEVDGLRIYHAGDLNWWHWEGEPAPYNEEMGKNYRSEIDRLENMPIDLAFVPVDPRLGGQAVWGLDYLMRHADVKTAVPMHFWEKERKLEAILADPVVKPYRDRILVLTRGEAQKSLA